MSEEKKGGNLCSTSDIDIYIQNNFSNNIASIEHLLNNFEKDVKCDNPILKKLIINTLKQPIKVQQNLPVKLEGSTRI